MKKIINSILIATIATACSYNNSIETTHTEEIPVSQKTITTLPIIPLNKSEVAKITGFSKCGDKIILGHFNAEYSAISINLKSKVREGILPSSRKRKEKAGLSAFQMNNNEATTFNFRTGEFKELSSPLSRSGSGNSNTIQLPKNQQHLQAVKAGPFVIATGIYEQGRYLLYCPETGIADYQLDYPSHPAYPSIKEKTKSILYASTVLKVRPDNQAFVSADIQSGNIEFCRIIGDRIEQVKAYCFHHPKVYINESAKCKVAYSRDNRSGFTDVAVSDDKVYAIYSGKTFRGNEQDFQQCNKMLVFDWQGNLLDTYSVDMPLTNISFDNTENMLYGLGRNPDPVLVQIPLQ